MNRKISIAWIDLTLEIKSIFSKKKIILDKLNGCAEFATLTAVMGPSGAGLTSLLMSLNGMNNSKLTNNSIIRLSNDPKIRSAFIGHNEKEILIMGLTAKQNMIYASKLKNSICGKDFDHELNVKKIMSDLLISDTIDTKAENCSGGEQKRLAIALELTALHKPNLILCDEPTTGLDSNVAEVVMMTLKELSVKHSISIITTIHQPNSDILEMFDNLYVLAKGGVCVYWGTPHLLTTHLRECNIICNRNQVPIEMLVTIGSKGIEDNTVVELRNKTSKEVIQSISNRLNETKVKKIERKNKRFSFKDIYLLLNRKFIELIAYKYLWISSNLIILSMISLFFGLICGEIGDYEDCIPRNAANNKNCLQQMALDSKVRLNFYIMNFSIWSYQLIQSSITMTEKINRLKLFTNEHQNKWYSTGVYYITESISDVIPNSISAAIFASILFLLTSQPNEAKRFWAFFYVFQLNAHLIQGFAHLVVILLFKYRDMCYLIGVVYLTSGTFTGGLFIYYSDFTDFKKILSNTSLLRFITYTIFIPLYGFNRCPKDQVSKKIIMLELDDDDLFFEQTSYLILQIVIIRAIALLILIFIKNPNIYQFCINYFQNKLIIGNSPQNQELELQSISRGVSERDAYIENLTEIPLSYDSDDSNDHDDSENLQNVEILEIISKQISIAWIDITLKANKTFYSKEKLILREIKGFVEFGSFTALMGPSGAGKTSLLKCLNGMHRNLMTKESKIYLSKFKKIRTCFIAQDQREHIINGLTVKQALIYASKLKNIGIHVNHQMITNELMSDLDLNDIKNNNIEKCSSGQQKRIVMAIELTSEVKPNLICVDEPTSGVDCFSALMMIRCFKSVAQKHRLSIITSIHQPNLEILVIFDMLYVLAKGGVCVYFGSPQNLRKHLNECHINCRENQIPIEVLVKMAANGYTHQSVIQLSEKTSKEMSFEDRLKTETNLYPNGIPIRSKSFSLQQMWYLLMRIIVYTVRYDWIQIPVYLIGTCARGNSNKINIP